MRLKKSPYTNPGNDISRRPDHPKNHSERQSLACWIPIKMQLRSTTDLRGIFPFESAAPICTPETNKVFAMSAKLAWAAKCRGDQPLSSRALASAPPAIRRCTSSAARCMHSAMQCGRACLRQVHENNCVTHCVNRALGRADSSGSGWSQQRGLFPSRLMIAGSAPPYRRASTQHTPIARQARSTSSGVSGWRRK